MTGRLDSPFGGKYSDQYNALWQALHSAAEASGHGGEHGVYAYLDGMPRTSLVVELVNELHALGFGVLPEEGGPHSATAEAGEQMKRAEKLLRAFAETCEHPAWHRQAIEDADALYSMRLKWGR